MHRCNAWLLIGATRSMTLRREHPGLNIDTQLELCFMSCAGCWSFQTGEE